MCGHHSQEAKALAKASSNVSTLLPQKAPAKAQSSSVCTLLTAKAKSRSPLLMEKALAKATSSTHLNAKAKAKQDGGEHWPLSSTGPEREMIVHG